MGAGRRRARGWLGHWEVMGAMLLLAGWVGDKPRLDLPRGSDGPQSPCSAPPTWLALQSPGCLHTRWPLADPPHRDSQGPGGPHLLAARPSAVPPPPHSACGKGLRGSWRAGGIPPDPTSPIRPAPHPPGGLQPSGLPTSDMLLTRGGPQYGDFKWKRGRTLGHPETARKIIPENA